MPNEIPTTPDQASARVLQTDSRREALARLSEGLGEREPFLLVTGEAGTGKTTLVREAAARWGSRAVVAFVANPAMSRAELVEEILRRFRVEPPAGASKPQLLERLEGLFSEMATGQRVPVVVIDDAHELSAELIGELRLLANATTQAGLKLEIVLVGLPNLETRLADASFAPLRQRVSAHCRMGPFSAPETRTYLQETLTAGDSSGGRFPRKVCGDIFRRTGGTPRAVHTLAVEAMRRARESGASMVGLEHVQAAAARFGIAATVNPPRTGADRAQPSPMAAPHTDRKVHGGAIADSARPPAGDGPSATPADEGVSPAGLEIDPTSAGHPTASPAPVQSVEPPAARDPAAPATGGPAPERAASPTASGSDARASEWVGRFIGPDEPRFGSLFGVALRPDVDDAVFDQEEKRIPVAEAGEPARRLPSRPHRTPKGRRRFRARPASFHFWWPPQGWVMPAAIAVLVLTGVTFLMARSRGPQPEGVGVAATEIEGGTGAKAPRAGGKTAAAQPKATSKTNKSTSSKQAQSASATSSSHKYALEVGEYAYVELAEAERDRIVAETGLKGWVIPRDGDAGKVYRVVLGIYRTAERAETGASLLFERELVTEARVIPLPPKSSRR